ncbi:MAG: N-6 DNA methylase [Thaumarchaeota archaeon]|nr:N-6 DNA methylase [Nitrososphaerota archaeon]
MAQRKRDGAWSPQTRASPEELVVRKFVEELTGTYGYPMTHIVTSPQHRVKGRPSGKAAYPVDIAVFESAAKRESQLKIIVECKAPNIKSGKAQLQDYLGLSDATVGVWFNGEGFAAIQKRTRRGRVEYVDIPDIPRLGERVEDIGMHMRKDLVAPHNLKRVFREIRNHLAGSSSSTTRDEAFAKGMINLILCKLYDEKYTRPGDMVKFRAGADEEPKAVARRIRDLLSGARDEYSDVFDRTDKIGLDAESTAHIVGRLQRYSLLDSERDAIADAFEVFIGPSLRGEKGQFFTPRNVVRAIVDILDIRHDDRVMDPACGSGGFLSECLRHIQRRVEQEGRRLGWPERRIEAEKVRRVSNQLSGIEKDSFLSKVAKSYMIILGDGRSGIMCANALESPERWENGAGSTPELGTYDVVVTNPPFGSKITVSGEALLSGFELGHKWRKSGGGGGVRGAPRKRQHPTLLVI